MRITQWDLPNETYWNRLKSFRKNIVFSLHNLFSNLFKWMELQCQCIESIINWRILYFIKWISTLDILKRPCSYNFKHLLYSFSDSCFRFRGERLKHTEPFQLSNRILRLKTADLHYFKRIQSKNRGSRQKT